MLLLVVKLVAVGEDVGIVVLVEDVQRGLELVLDHGLAPEEILLVHLVAVGEDFHVAGGGVEAVVLCDEALVGEHGHVIGLGREDIPSGQEAGIVVEAEEVQQGGQDVHGGAIGIHLDGLDVRDVADKGVAELLKGLVHLVPGQLAELVDGEAVGVVVVGEDDDGLVGHAGLLQPLHQVGERLLQLVVAGDVGLHRLRIGEIFGHGLVLEAHGVVPVVLIVPREGHVVGVEGLVAA